MVFIFPRESEFSLSVYLVSQKILFFIFLLIVVCGVISSITCGQRNYSKTKRHRRWDKSLFSQETSIFSDLRPAYIYKTMSKSSFVLTPALKAIIAQSSARIFGKLPVLNCFPSFMIISSTLPLETDAKCNAIDFRLYLLFIVGNSCRSFHTVQEINYSSKSPSVLFWLITIYQI